MSDNLVFDLNFKSALIVGSTGLVGNLLMRDLIHHPQFEEIHSLSRRPSKLQSHHLKEHIIDFDAIEALDDTANGFDSDVLFIALGTTIKAAGSKEKFRQVDHDYPMAIARKALAAGCSACHVVSSVGADPKSSIFYSRVKGELEADLKVLGFKTLCIYQPSMLLGDRKEQRIGESIGKVVMKALAPAMLGPLKTYRPIHAATVADAMLKNAVSEVKGIHTLSSDQIKQRVYPPAEPQA